MRKIRRGFRRPPSYPSWHCELLRALHSREVFLFDIDVMQKSVQCLFPSGTTPPLNWVPVVMLCDLPGCTAAARWLVCGRRPGLWRWTDSEIWLEMPLQENGACFYRRISTGARLCEVQDELLTFEAQRLPPGPWKYEYCSSQPWCELDMLTTPVGDSVDLKLVSESWHVRKYGRCCTCGPGS